MTTAEDTIVARAGIQYGLKDGELTMVEIERKFLVTDVPSDLSNRPAVAVRQGYLAADDEAEVRLRSKGGECSLTVKRGRGLVRDEREVVLESHQFDGLWPATEGRRIEKTRFAVPVASTTAEVDVYAGSLEGLVTVEVEFPTQKEARSFAPPRWFGREVTGDDRYANRSLATTGRPGD